jgi:aspartyl-tRNA synthetase
VHPGKVYALPQSPQTLKQLLMLGGTDRYFQICKCFRDEDLRADRQPEFTQIDIEASFVGQEFMQELALVLMRNAFEDQSLELVPMKHSQAIEDYGTDKPDVRFGLKHINVSELFKGAEFKAFADVVDQAGLVKAFFSGKRTQ